MQFVLWDADAGYVCQTLEDMFLTPSKAESLPAQHMRRIATGLSLILFSWP